MFDVFYRGRRSGLFAHERPAESLDHAAEQSRTRFFWYLDSDNDYAAFDFDWLPDRWEQEQIHAFVDQQQSYLGVCFAPKSYHKDTAKNYKIAATIHRSYHAPVYYLDHGNTGSDQTFQGLKTRGLEPIRMAFVGSYQEMLGRVAKQAAADNVWVVSSLGDYSDFDFTWAPVPWKRDVLHVFSEDTFFLGAAAFREQFRNLIALDRFRTFERCTGQQVPGRTPLDIIYVSNGETEAERWYQHLCSVVGGQPNRLLRVKDVPGRTLALRRAAELSTTPWFFVVPAKLEVSPEFDWRWQPDYLKAPAHYIFYCHNPVNGLEYGHMAMVAYNRELALSTFDPGLDFTMSQPHDVVPQVVGTAHYNADPLMAWRTAFREAIKLKRDVMINHSSESEHRLAQWLTGQGQNAEWSKRGAVDGIDYYDSVDGDLSQLMLSYEWQWLDRRFKSRYG